MAEVKIAIKKNGPYRVKAPEGAIQLVDADGNQYDLKGKTAFSLCRCAVLRKNLVGNLTETQSVG